MPHLPNYPREIANSCLMREKYRLIDDARDATKRGEYETAQMFWHWITMLTIHLRELRRIPVYYPQHLYW